MSWRGLGGRIWIDDNSPMHGSRYGRKGSVQMNALVSPNRVVTDWWANLTLGWCQGCPLLDQKPHSAIPVASKIYLQHPFRFDRGVGHGRRRPAIFPSRGGGLGLARSATAHLTSVTGKGLRSVTTFHADVPPPRETKRCAEKFSPQCAGFWWRR